MENYHTAYTAKAADIDKMNEAVRFIAQEHRDHPPVRVKSPQDDDPDFTGVWFGGWLARNFPPEMLYVAPVKRPRGRTRLDGLTPGSPEAKAADAAKAAAKKAKK